LEVIRVVDGPQWVVVFTAEMAVEREGLEVEAGGFLLKHFDESRVRGTVSGGCRR